MSLTEVELSSERKAFEKWAQETYNILANDEIHLLPLDWDSRDGEPYWRNTVDYLTLEWRGWLARAELEKKRSLK